MTILHRARQRVLYSNHIRSLLRTHFPMAHKHLVVMSQQQLADLVWATGRLLTVRVFEDDDIQHHAVQQRGVQYHDVQQELKTAVHGVTTSGADTNFSPPPIVTQHPSTSHHPLHAASIPLQLAALHMFPVARTFGTGGRRAEQLAKLLLGVLDSNNHSLDDGTIAMLHNYTTTLLPCSKGRALADFLTVWERRPELMPVDGMGLHTARVDAVVRGMQLQGHGTLGPRELVRVLRYWVQHVGRVPEGVDAEAYGNVLTGCLMHMHVADVANMVDAWTALGGAPRSLDWDMCMAVLRAHDYGGGDVGHS